MAGLFALVAAGLCFMVPLAVPLFAMRWRSFFVLLGLGAAFFGWLTLDLPNPQGISQMLGSFLGGLMLIGFAAGAIAKFVMLVGRRPG